jgi:NADPH:quinone reductase-like Zn-dependent oxidoreductase
MFAITATAITPDDPLAGLTLGDHPEPSPPDGWEVVEVRAAALNHHDVWTLRGVGIDADRLPIVLGCDAAGVTADGREVIVHAVVATPDGGDETLARDFSILSERYDGTFADRVAVPSRNLVPKPASMSFEEAACLPVAYLTAYRMLFTRGELRPGDRVLVQGAGGGVATASILLARAAGLHVTVTSRDEAKLERALELGAHVGVAAGERLPGRVDAVMETVGEATWSHSLRALEPGGVVVVSGATSGPNPPADLTRVFYRQLRVVGSTMGTRDELVRLSRLLDATGVRPLIDDVLPMTEARTAFERMVTGDLFGKLVLTR